MAVANATNSIDTSIVEYNMFVGSSFAMAFIANSIGTSANAIADIPTAPSNALVTDFMLPRIETTTPKTLINVAISIVTYSILVGSAFAIATNANIIGTIASAIADNATAPRTAFPPESSLPNNDTIVPNTVTSIPISLTVYISLVGSTSVSTARDNIIGTILVATIPNAIAPAIAFGPDFIFAKDETNAANTVTNIPISIVAYSMFVGSPRDITAKANIIGTIASAIAASAAAPASAFLPDSILDKATDNKPITPTSAAIAPTEFHIR